MRWRASVVTFGVLRATPSSPQQTRARQWPAEDLCIFTKKISIHSESVHWVVPSTRQHRLAKSLFHGFANQRDQSRLRDDNKGSKMPSISSTGAHLLLSREANQHMQQFDLSEAQRGEQEKLKQVRWSEQKKFQSIRLNRQNFKQQLV